MFINLFILLSVFLFGLIIGSFLNCLIYRLEKRAETEKKACKKGSCAFFQGRSFCPHCRHTLSWRDLIPVLSFFLLRGKCRYCFQKISWQYPIVEIATGLLFLLIFNFQFSIFNFIIVPFLIIIFVYDLKHYIIPDKIIYPAIGIALIYNFQFLFNQFSIFKLSILSALLAAGFFLTIVMVTRGRGMGVGDIKLAFLMGLFLGFPNILLALFSAFLIGAIIGTGLIIFKNKTLKSEIPFGPFLVGGTLIALFWGEQIVNWYFNLFL